MALHFVGFKDDRVWNALCVFGPPDFWHRSWDSRARAEIVEGDIAVFATGSIEDEPKPNAWDDSQADINARTPSYLSCKAQGWRAVVPSQSLCSPRQWNSHFELPLVTRSEL